MKPLSSIIGGEVSGPLTASCGVPGFDTIALPGSPDWRVKMPYFLLLAVLLFPRIVLVLIWFFSTYLQRAFYGGLLLPVFGFLFLPLTTIVYAWELK